MSLPARWREHATWRRAGSSFACLCVAAAGPLQAQPREATPLDPVVVTATRSDGRAFDLPVAIDTVTREQIQNGQLGVNLSESLARVPGMSIQSRWNYAQDLQLSIRGFGARANFGVRGVRLYQDHIPATMPDGQGQTGSFSLVSAQRIEVLRGPFSSLYGNASGGVISVFTESGPQPPQASAQLLGGSFGTWNAVAKLEGEGGPVNYVVAGNLFRTGGYRDHSEASRDLANVKLVLAAAPDTTITVIGNALRQPDAQDPLGLTRAQWEANPRQADPAAIRFDTRKTVNQSQGGATLEQRFGADGDLRVTGYGGTRAVRQYLALSGTAPFETPTFAELAYRPAGSGLNLGLQPAVSDSGEIGLKALIGTRHRINLALFNVETSDEIIVDTAVGGRTTYKNAAGTRRRGAELSWEGDLGAGFTGYAAYTWLSAKFTSEATTGLPPQRVPVGARLPGVPVANAYAEL